ncbi:VOC family protein [Cochlodiniinecator piscidefendens]|uniref:VOC family protein n=1 Tax=Cochlodiniinecator piscidefendens TaxID=2715756 RepID=UPI00140A0B5D|nr:VOC family protein [Cochlodiniinecator piscidefendens]
MLHIDHIAIAATNLADGVAYVEDVLGVSMAAGGKHAAMGTHNRLLGLQNGLYLEVIAVDPDALPPARSRWFDLDDFTGPPRLANWIVVSSNIVSLTENFPEFGRPVALQRGTLSWSMAVPDNGKLPFGGLHPAALEWQSGGHPSQHLQPSGCGLEALVLSHPEIEKLRLMLPNELDPRVHFETGDAGIKAHMKTPNGYRTLT